MCVGACEASVGALKRHDDFPEVSTHIILHHIILCSFTLCYTVPLCLILSLSNVVLCLTSHDFNILTVHISVIKCNINLLFYSYSLAQIDLIFYFYLFASYFILSYLILHFFSLLNKSYYLIFSFHLSFFLFLLFFFTIF